jgi:hypothetical protein
MNLQISEQVIAMLLLLCCLLLLLPVGLAARLA